MPDAPPKPICFVVSPIGEPGSEIRKRADLLIRFVLNPVLAENYEVIRADHITVPGSINRQVFDYLLNSALVVADLTGHNPNVFYELAVRHSFAKPYVQLIHAEDKIPFDLADQRTIRVDLADLESVDAAKTALGKLAEATRKPGFRVITPIGEAAGVTALLEDASAEVRNVINVVEERFALHDDKLLELATEVAALRRWLHNTQKRPPFPNSAGSAIPQAVPAVQLASGVVKEVEEVEEAGSRDEPTFLMPPPEELRSKTSG